MFIFIYFNVYLSRFIDLTFRQNLDFNEMYRKADNKAEMTGTCALLKNERPTYYIFESKCM